MLQKEKELNKAPKAQRELFRYLRENMQFSDQEWYSKLNFGTTHCHLINF